MDSSVTTIFAAVAGAAAGAAVKASAPYLGEVVAGKVRINSKLVGEWRCTWICPPEAEEEKIDDRVTISKVRGERLWGLGDNTKYGGYKITGRVSPSLLVTLHYEGLNERQPLGGVVIMELYPTWDKMKGKWYEYGRKRMIIGGSTSWEKVRR